MKHVLITGASSGVGAATARAFAARGDRVTLVARSADTLHALADEIGDRAHPAPCDAADGEAVAAMARLVTAETGTPDVIVNSAGAGEWKPLADTSPAELQTMIDAPYLAAAFVTQAFLADMRTRGSGTVIHVNSPAAYAPWPNAVGYTAARAALRGLHEALAQDLHGTGLRSCHAVFGEIDSPYFETNAVARASLPMLGRTLPRLSVAHCAKVILGLADRPRHVAISPALLRVYIATACVAPWLTRPLLRL